MKLGKLSLSYAFEDVPNSPREYFSCVFDAEDEAWTDVLIALEELWQASKLLPPWSKIRD